MNKLYLELYRLASAGDDSLGALYVRRDGKREFWCFTLEDEQRPSKVPGETRIPGGLYKLALRNEGSQTKRYAKKFPQMHRGMIHVQNVPGFAFVHIHIGNTDEDTDGCILVGDGAYQNVTEPGRLIASTSAYERIYPQIADAIESGADVSLMVVDFA